MRCGYAAAGFGKCSCRVCSPAPLHFDLSVFDIFASCQAAACMVVAPENMTVFPSRLAGWIGREQVTVWYSVPSVLTMLTEYGNLRAAGLSRLEVGLESALRRDHSGLHFWRVSWPGAAGLVLIGIGCVLLAVGWINRTGEFFDPRPWWALGSAFLVAGVAAHAVRERR